MRFPIIYLYILFYHIPKTFGIIIKFLICHVYNDLSNIGAADCKIGNI